jgi:hypothetical protein
MSEILKPIAGRACDCGSSRIGDHRPAGDERRGSTERDDDFGHDPPQAFDSHRNAF